MMTAPFAIVAKNLTLGYKQHPVIYDFNAEFTTEHFVGVFGPNGAGKTTLLRSLLGLIKPIKGTLTVLDKEPHSGNPLIGYVPQLIPTLSTAIDSESFLMATLRGQRWGLPIVTRAQRKRVQEMLSRVGAQNYAKRSFNELSGGERQRIMLAQALLSHPKILLLDEPLSNLDIHYQQVLLSLLKELQQELQVTLLLTAHDVNPLLSIMNQVLYLAKGHAAIGSVAEVITSQTLTDLYETPIEVIEQKGRIFVMHSMTGLTENIDCG